jgi:PAS domain S-box-containing protein
MSKEDVLNRMLARERAARKEAELIMEDKSRELFESNSKLIALNSSLEQEVQKRTRISRRSERQLRTLFQSHPIPLIVHHMTSNRFLAVNQTAIDNYGYTEEEFLNMCVQDLYPQAELDALQQHLDTGLVGNGLVNRWKHISRSGKLFDVEISETSIEYDEQPARLVLITDVSDRIASENERRSRAKKYKALVESVSDIIYRCSEEGTFTYVNPSAIDTCGYSAEELYGQHFLTLVRADFKKEVILFYLKQVAENIESTYLEFPMICKDGALVWLGQTVNLHSLDNGEFEIIARARNVTERKKVHEAIAASEEKYRQILENMKLGLLEVNRDDIITNAYPKFCELTGYSRDELVGKSAVKTLLSEDFSDVILKQSENRAEGKAGVYEVKIICKDGSAKWVIISGAPHYDPDGNLEGSVGIYLDITERKAMEDELVAAKDIAENSAKTKEQFMANMSHEIRTPMNAIMGMGDLLERTDLNHKQRQFVEAIQTSADNLLIIINDILDFSKIESGKLSLESVPVDLLLLMRNACKTVELKAESKGLILEIELDDNSRGCKADPTRLYQVIVNLLSNAVKFTEEGKIILLCERVGGDADFHVLHFSIEDTGVGIRPDELENIFETFSQAEQNTTRKYGGSGLGLSISRQLIHMMGGDLQVESEIGKGSKFYFTLKLEKCQVPKIENSEVVEHSEALVGIKVLLVEDHAINRFVAETILENWKCIVEVATNGLEAVEKVKNHQFDVVLMDMRMPEMDGITATKVIRNQLNSAVPIIAMTANAIKGDGERCINAGMNDYVSKPFKRQVLLEKILQHTGGAATERAGESTEKSWIDLSGLEEVVQGDRDFFKKMIQLFVDDTPIAIQQMEAAMDSSNYKVVIELVHRLKPSVDHLANEQLRGMMREVEAAFDQSTASVAKRLSLIANLKELVEQLKQQL